MCVICYSPKGVEAPTEEKLKQMWNANSDGAGYAYIGKNGQVIYSKGFMKFEELMEELRPLERFKETHFVIHFRIGTSGKNDPHTCHPFPISTNFGELRKINGKVDAVLFHNGILGDGKLVNPLSSDTQDFVVAMAPLFKKYNKSKARDHFIAGMTQGSKLLILYKNGKIKAYGKWETDGKLWVSNTNYLYSWHSYSSSDAARVNGGHNWYDDWEEYNYSKYHTNATVETIKDYDHLTEEEKATARALWNKIKTNEWAYLSRSEMSLLKRSAEDYTRTQLYKDNFVFGYDPDMGSYGNEAMVWLEQTPEEQGLPRLEEYDEDDADDIITNEELEKVMDKIGE